VGASPREVNASPLAQRRRPRAPTSPLRGCATAVATSFRGFAPTATALGPFGAGRRRRFEPEWSNGTRQEVWGRPRLFRDAVEGARSQIHWRYQKEEGSRQDAKTPRREKEIFVLASLRLGEILPFLEMDQRSQRRRLSGRSVAGQLKVAGCGKRTRSKMVRFARGRRSGKGSVQARFARNTGRHASGTRRRFPICSWIGGQEGGFEKQMVDCGWGTTRVRTIG
jgi:hypothetical protein